MHFLVILRVNFNLKLQSIFDGASQWAKIVETTSIERSTTTSILDRQLYAIYVENENRVDVEFRTSAEHRSKNVLQISA